MKAAGKRAGIDPAYMCRSDRSGLGLPLWARRVVRKANSPKNATIQCWLDQAVREGESMYAVAIKPPRALTRVKRRGGPDLEAA